jgi:TetR/AcrR family transcriptional regulator, cholesterol catabolism regulator
MASHTDDPTSQLDRATWRQILTAAKALFLAKGYRGVSMKELAHAVQVTPGALYYHFPRGKEDLFTRMIRTVYVEEGMAGIDQALGAGQTLRERLTLFTTALLTLPIDERFALLLRDAREHIKDPDNQRVILALRDHLKQRTTGLFQTAQDANEIRTDIPVSLLVSLYMGMLREATHLQGTGQVAQLVSVLLDGVAPATRSAEHRRADESAS